jgi:hypothetical protein
MRKSLRNVTEAMDYDSIVFIELPNGVYPV